MGIMSATLQEWDGSIINYSTLEKMDKSCLVVRVHQLTYYSKMGCCDL